MTRTRKFEYINEYGSPSRTHLCTDPYSFMYSNFRKVGPISVTHTVFQMKFFPQFTSIPNFIATFDATSAANFVATFAQVSLKGSAIKTGIPFSPKMNKVFSNLRYNILQIPYHYGRRAEIICGLAQSLLGQHWRIIAHPPHCG